MSQQLKPAPVAPPADTLVYRPISGLAVASLIIAIIYSFVILVLGGLAVYSGYALPLGTWSLLFTIAAGTLALLARRQIRLSEGTRSGLALAGWAWWLSIGFGLGYAAIYVGTYLALTWQAKAFADRFLNLLRDGKVNHAFLQTEAPDVRQSVDASNQQVMNIRFETPLKKFNQNELIRILQQAGTEAVFRDLGVSTWEYDKGYHIVQNYRISTPEGDFDATLSLRSSEDRKTRGWRIAAGESDLSASTAKLTPYGETLRKWRQESQIFVFQWLQKRNFSFMNEVGQLDAVFLDTLEPSQRGLWKSYVVLASMSDIAALAGVLGAAGQNVAFIPQLTHHGNREWRWFSFYPGYWAFATGALAQTDKLDAPTKYRDEIRREAANLFNHRTRALLKQTEGNTGIPQPFDTKTQRMRVVHNIDVESVAVDPEALKFHAQGHLIVESDPGEFSLQRTPQWRIVALQLLTGGEPPPEDPLRRRDSPPARREPRGIRPVQINAN